MLGENFEQLSMFGSIIAIQFRKQTLDLRLGKVEHTADDVPSPIDVSRAEESHHDPARVGGQFQGKSFHFHGHREFLAWSSRCAGGTWRSAGPLK